LTIKRSVSGLTIQIARFTIQLGRFTIQNTSFTDIKKAIRKKNAKKCDCGNEIWAIAAQLFIMLVLLVSQVKRMLRKTMKSARFVGDVLKVNLVENCNIKMEAWYNKNNVG
jgi:hypothetical protein